MDAGDASGGAPPDRGFEALSWDELPALRSSTYRIFSSYDRNEESTYEYIAKGNKDFNNWLARCGDVPNIVGDETDGVSCEPGLHGYLIAADDAGPGYVSRIFFTHMDLDTKAPADQERIRIYVDDLDVPAYDGKLSDWTNGVNEPFVEPLVGWTSGALVSYVPISYQSKLRVLLDDLSATAGYYYQVDVRSSEATASFDPAKLPSVARLAARLETDAKLGTDRTTWTNSDFTLPAGETAHLLDRAGTGTIGSLRVTTDATADALGDVELRITWDDAPSAAITLPLSWLFGQRPVPAAFETLPMTVRLVDRSVEMTLSLPMPFSSRARIDAVNFGAVSHSLHAKIDGAPGNVVGAGHLHADSQERHAPMTDASFPVASLSGTGRYLGSILFLTGHADPAALFPDPLNFLEGDDVLRVDGRFAGNGTGTEDFLDGGWYFENGPYSAPFSALISKTDSSAQPTGQITAVRWQTLGDAVDFDDSLELSLEYGAHAPGAATDYASVAFYYQK